MTHERDQAHALTIATPSTDSDHELAPGRATRTSHLIGPTGVRPSGLLQRKAVRDDHGVAADADRAVAAASASSGTGLPDELRGRFEGSLGTELSGVRVHTGAASADAASAVGARAYTVGNDIHFAAGQYDPGSAAGQHLIAHEVAHTVQQRGGTQAPQFKLEVSSPGDHFEHEADRAADAMVTGAPATVGGASGLGSVVQRAAAVGVSGSVGRKKAVLKIPVTGTVSKKFNYVEVEGEVKGEVQGKLTYPDVVTGEQGESGESEDVLLKRWEMEAKDKVEGEKPTYLEGFHVVDVKVVGKKERVSTQERKEGKTEGKTERSIGVELEVAFQNGAKVSLSADVLGLETGKKGVEYSGPNLALEVVPGEKAFGPYDLPKDAKLSGTVGVGLSGKLKPSWEKIIGKQVIDKVLDTGEKAAEKAVDLVAELAESSALEIAGFAAVAVAVGAELVIGATAITAMEKTEAKIEHAIHAFGNGALTALGVPQPAPGGYAQFWVQGQTQYAGTVEKLGQKILANPRFADARPVDVMNALHDAAAHQAGDLRGKIEASVRPGIADAYAKAYFKEQNAKKWIFESDARREAQGIAEHEGGSTELDVKSE